VSINASPRGQRAVRALTGSFRELRPPDEKLAAVSTRKLAEKPGVGGPRNVFTDEQSAELLHHVPGLDSNPRLACLVGLLAVA
jgi:hypothetical protein